jgi:1-acyl-sn-glycerol-3-phosphate acyltransferase
MTEEGPERLGSFVVPGDDTRFRRRFTIPAVKRLGALRVTSMRQRLSEPIQAFQAHFTTSGVRFIGTRLFGFRIEVSGREHVPAGEPLIVAGGPHRNWVDGFLLLVALPPQPRVVFLASEHVSDRWWKRALVRLAGGFEPVSTTSVLNREVLAAALLVLARGDRLGVFPEGWDHLEGPMREIGDFRRGLAFIAQQSGRCVLPVALAGSKPLWRGKTLHVRIGAPLDPPPMDAGKVAQQTWSDELRATLQELIPPEPPEIPLERRRWPWLTDLFN